MGFRIAINGYGRIGQCVLRALLMRDAHFDIVAINELADADTIAYLTRYDTTHGRFPFSITQQDDRLQIGRHSVRLLSEKKPENIPWDALGVDLVLECSGSFNDRATAEKHLASGAGRILISHPNCGDVDSTIVYGINHRLLQKDHRVVSNASCTTNCLLPVLHLLERDFGVVNGVVTTVHSAMNDQPVIDSYHNTNLRLSRSALQSIVPVDTGLARGIERIDSRFADKFECLHLRVPTINVSLLDISINLKKDATVAEINALFEEASLNGLKGLLGFTREPNASVDFNTDSRSCIVDATQTRVCGGTLVKLICWFDNEWGFANRMVDVAEYWQGLQ